MTHLPRNKQYVIVWTEDGMELAQYDGFMGHFRLLVDNIALDPHSIVKWEPVGSQMESNKSEAIELLQRVLDLRKVRSKNPWVWAVLFGDIDDFLSKTDEKS